MRHAQGLAMPLLAVHFADGLAPADAGGLDNDAHLRCPSRRRNGRIGSAPSPHGLFPRLRGAPRVQRKSALLLAQNFTHDIADDRGELFTQARDLRLYKATSALNPVRPHNLGTFEEMDFG